jgi:hypothetical protein
MADTSVTTAGSEPGVPAMDTGMPEVRMVMGRLMPPGAAWAAAAGAAGGSCVVGGRLSAGAGSAPVSLAV